MGALDVENGDLSPRADCIRYIRASKEDVDDERWDEILAKREETVARAWILMMETDDWPDLDEDDERPELVDVIDDAMATDWLVYTTRDEKIRLLSHLDAVLAEVTE